MRLHLTLCCRKGWWLLLIVVMVGVAACQAEPDEVAVYDCYAIPEAVVTAQSRWTARQLMSLCSLWLGSLEPLEPDPTNAVADNLLAAQWGEQLFFDSRLSADETVACATCHNPALSFTDGLPVAQGLGTGVRNTPTIVGTAYSPWFFWDGHKDSQWAQALEPLETNSEHGLKRQDVGHLIANDAEYRATYETIFGPVPDLGTDEAVTDLFVNVGKAIAAYERRIIFTPAPFDDYVAALLKQDNAGMDAALSDAEEAGLALFIGSGQCINCHNGALFTNNDFHNIAVSTMPEAGRYEGAQLLLADEFNCKSKHSDAKSDEACAELLYIKTSATETLGAFKTPTLRNVAQTAPYMHTGQFETLAEVLQHYNTGVNLVRPPSYGHNELNPINLTKAELAQVEAFLHSLVSPVTILGREANN